MTRDQSSDRPQEPLLSFLVPEPKLGVSLFLFTVPYLQADRTAVSVKNVDDDRAPVGVRQR